MRHITTRPFHIMADCGKVYQFLAGIYERNWKQHTVFLFGGQEALMRCPNYTDAPKRSAQHI